MNLNNLKKLNILTKNINNNELIYKELIEYRNEIKLNPTYDKVKSYLNFLIENLDAMEDEDLDLLLINEEWSSTYIYEEIKKGKSSYYYLKFLKRSIYIFSRFLEKIENQEKISSEQFNALLSLKLGYNFYNKMFHKLDTKEKIKLITLQNEKIEILSKVHILNYIYEHNEDILNNEKRIEEIEVIALEDNVLVELLVELSLNHINIKYFNFLLSFYKYKLKNDFMENVNIPLSLENNLLNNENYYMVSEKLKNVGLKVRGNRTLSLFAFNEMFQEELIELTNYNHVILSTILEFLNYKYNKLSIEEIKKIKKVDLETKKIISINKDI